MSQAQPPVPEASRTPRARPAWVRFLPAIGLVLAVVQVALWGIASRWLEESLDFGSAAASITVGVVFLAMWLVVLLALLVEDHRRRGHG